MTTVRQPLTSLVFLLDHTMFRLQTCFETSVLTKLENTLSLEIMVLHLNDKPFNMFALLICYSKHRCLSHHRLFFKLCVHVSFYFFNVFDLFSTFLNLMVISSRYCLETVPVWSISPHKNEQHK